MKKTDLSIVIVSYNTTAITKNCIDSLKGSLASSPLSVEIIVIDNASEDDSPRMLRKEAALNRQENIVFRLIFNKKNVGFGRASNQGVREASSDYTLLLNSDTLVIDTAVEKLLQFYKNNETTVHFAGGKLFNEDGSTQPSCGPFFSLPVVFVSQLLFGDRLRITLYSPNSQKRVDWLSGSCILFKKSLFEELGGFDENIFMYFEEVDLFYRARQKGFQAYFYPGAHFTHIGHSSGSRSFAIIQKYKGFIYFYKKHHSKGQLTFLRFLLQLKARVAIAIGAITRKHYLVETYEKALKSI